MAPKVPVFHQFFNPVIEALHGLGGSSTISELEDEVVGRMGLSPEVAEVPHGATNQTEVGYRIAWARTYLKKYGVLANSSRGVWSLTEQGKKTRSVDSMEVRQVVKALDSSVPSKSATLATPDSDDPDSESGWRDVALDAMKSMDPSGFERLCQRVLRESGFIEVEVTGRSSDGGIDGRGILRLGGLISFTVMFQAKRYKDSVGSSVVRDFRGALMGRADKGLIITTGRFTSEAHKEATRDGATPIDLIDGNLLVDKLKELSLGIETRVVEEVDVQPEFFANF